MKILLDNGHGLDTPGKRSPDGRFREYLYTRQIAASVALHLQYRGYDAELLVPEENDIPLPERVRRVNERCAQFGADNVCLVSIHVNAAGDGTRWMNARGWSAYTSRGQTAGDRLADCLYEAAALYLPGHKLRKDHSDGDADLEADFYILRHTRCAAVITENLFMDNQADVEYLLSDIGQTNLVNLHVTGINFYLGIH